MFYSMLASSLPICSEASFYIGPHRMRPWDFRKTTTQQLAVHMQFVLCITFAS